MFKKFFFCSAAFLSLIAAQAQPIKTPAPSPTQTIKQEFGISNVELTYSRPNIKGRKVFGDLVPYGKLWRTGANAATRIKFADDVKIGGTDVKAGEYVLYTIPTESEWEVVLNKGLSNWGIDGYKQEEDVARVKVKSAKLNESQETFTMQFVNVKPSSADLQIMWDKTAVNVPITTDIDKKIMAQINNAMNKDNRPYFQSAMYYMESGKDMNQALAWFDKAVEQNPSAFWIHHQRANALAKLGKKEDARAAANKSIELAKQAKNDDYVKLNEKLLADLK
jgi:tetratricopeptide (TPR) repeat protein